MMIKSLSLINFKCIKDMFIEFSPDVTNIYGANGVGKTTIVDAVNFLLYQKDAQGKSDTSMRPYGADGELIHDIDTVVKGVFSDANGDFTLEVVYKEKWTKVSGAAERKLMGNTTEYYIDGVPKKQADYKAFVAENFKEPWFSLTSNPNTFPNLKWQDQRKLLIELFGQNLNEEELLSRAEFSAISADIKKYGVADLKAKFLKEKKSYAKEVVELPARIDERRKSLSSIEDAAKVEADARLVLMKYEKPLEELQTKRAAILTGVQRSALEGKIAVLEGKLEAIRNVRRDNLAKIKAPFLEKAAEIKARSQGKEEQISLLRKQLLNVERSIASRKEDLGKLGDTWESVDSEVFSDTECPCCHRPYTEEMLQPMLEQFNQSKSERLEEINKKGIAIKELLDKDVAAKEELLTGINKLSVDSSEADAAALAENNKKMQAAVDKLAPLEEFIHPESREKFWDLTESLKLRKQELDECRLDINIQIQKVDREIAETSAPVEKAREALARIRIDNETREAIAQLEDKKQKAMLLQGEAEAKLAALDQYVSQKMQLLSDGINKAFANVNFKLFERNISNEGIVETCELTMNGVPYRQLSTAEKCKAGMDVIDAISGRLNLCNPVFIDNRESISFINQLGEYQIINLFVSPEDTVLRIERL